MKNFRRFCLATALTATALFLFSVSARAQDAALSGDVQTQVAAAVAAGDTATLQQIVEANPTMAATIANSVATSALALVQGTPLTSAVNTAVALAQFAANIASTTVTTTGVSNSSVTVAASATAIAAQVAATPVVITTAPAAAANIASTASATANVPTVIANAPVVAANIVASAVVTAAAPEVIAAAPAVSGTIAANATLVVNNPTVQAAAPEVAQQVLNTANNVSSNPTVVAGDTVNTGGVVVVGATTGQQPNTHETISPAGPG